jgi:hypothetical protein
LLAAAAALCANRIPARHNYALALHRQNKSAAALQQIVARAEFGADAPDPIFIVGLPRAGSTLIEQILASHSAVEGTMELPDILSIAQSLKGRKMGSGKAKYPGATSPILPFRICSSGVP